MAASDLRVSYGTHYGLRWLLNVHESPVNWISVGGKKYDAAKGDAPFHLKIPEWNTIFFVITVNNYDEFAHFVSLKDGKDISMPVDYRFDSYRLGAQKKEGRYVSIDGVNGRKVLVSCHNYDGRISHFTFDLEARSWQEEEETPAPKRVSPPAPPERHG